MDGAMVELPGPEKALLHLYSVRKIDKGPGDEWENAALAPATVIDVRDCLRSRMARGHR
jgi:hypothetical protein